MIDKAAFDARLTELWNRRGMLDSAEWAELYTMVEAVLRKCRSTWFAGLRDDRGDYVNGYFLKKVMLPANQANEERIVTGNHLLGFFKNYLKDQLNWEMRRGAGITDSLTDLQSDDDEGSDQNTALGNGREFNFSPDEIEETLAHYGLNRAQLTASAQAFFGQLQQWQQQVLSSHLCAESGQALTLSQLQEQFPQTATYYKVKQLGVVHSLRSLPPDYHKTEIGRWLTRQLKLTLALEDYPMLIIALQVLCLVALQILDE